MTWTSPESEIRTSATEWRNSRRLYGIYSAVISHFDVGVPPCPDLECPIDRHDYVVRGRVRNWLNLMDNHCPVTFLRQVLQRDAIGTEANLKALIRRHLERSHKTEFDRDKLDFLMVQYFEQCAPDEIVRGDLSVADVGKVLEPVLGGFSPVTPYWLKVLDGLASDLASCQGLQDMEDRKILERGREIKAAAGIRFFEGPALISFTRYNIFLRRAFFAAMTSDLNAVRRNVALLRQRGVKAIDASRAGLSDHEVLRSVERICREWRSIFQSEYSAGHVFRSIKELRACTQAALDGAAEKQEPKAGKLGKKKAKAMTALETGASPVGVKTEVDLPESTNDDELDRALSVFDHEAAPESTVEQVYPELTLEADPVAGTPARFKVPDVMAVIQQQIAWAKEGNALALSVRLEKSAIRLASWEIDSFLAEDEDPRAPIRRSVAARLILQEAFDDFQDGYTGDMPVALTISHGEIGRLQEDIAEARDARNAELIVSLAASGQRLLELMHEAHFAWNQEAR